ncbi:LuxR C-terminal-related transcriptional regulator [Streptomyces sp900105245]|uniref:LuxR C-terminal-related transcriptional regulator n=1 Tax=Streptomyces sp. 900105245 TaxID=3154379 RepID=A0ABV1UM09_9ACTN
MVGAQWRLAGRSEELKAFDHAWGARRCQVVVVAGSAGVGKTRLAEECLARVMKDGWKGARATATAAAAAVPLGAVAHLIPDGVDLSDPVAGFAQVARALAGTRKDRRWALLIDDLHLLDTSSAVLLRQLLDARVIRMIATLRVGEVVSAAVNAVAISSDQVHRIDIAPFGHTQVEQVLHTALGQPVGRRTLYALYSASGGNALYLRELVEGALAAGTLTSDGEIWELTEGSLATTPRLTELINARLSSTDSDARNVLEFLALCEPLPLSHVAAAATSPQTLSSLESHSVIKVTQDGKRTFVSLAHPLYGEILRAGTPPLRRRQLLLAQVERTQRFGARRREDAVRLASWQLAASNTAAPDLLVRAATLARHTHDLPRVVALLQVLPEAFQTIGTRLMLAEAVWELGNPQGADAVLVKAESQSVAESELLSIAFVRCIIRYYSLNSTDQALDIIEKTRPHVLSNAGQRALNVTEGWLRAVSGQIVKGLEILDALEPDVMQAADVNVWIWGAAIKTFALAAVGRAEEAAAWAAHAHSIFVHEQKNAILPHPSAFYMAKVLAETESGRIMRARALGERAYNEMVVAGEPFAVAYLAFYLARAEYTAGHLATARRWYAEAARLAFESQHTSARQMVLSGLAASAALLGDLDTAERAKSQAAISPRLGIYPGEERLGEAWLHAVRGNLSRARSVLHEAAIDAQKAGSVSSEMLLLTEIARLGDAAVVTDRVTELAELSQGGLATARAHFVHALATNNADLLARSASELETIGADLLAAEAAAQAASNYHCAGDKRRAAATTNHAASLADRCEGAQTPLLAPPQAASSLTKREREVAFLAAGGYPSKDIAEALHLSVRTVDNHLQHAYTKIGVTTRQQLASALNVKKTRPNSSLPTDRSAF